MIQQVLMPKLGQTMEEATVERWLKQEGDAVNKGDILLEITTDKATLEVESYVKGTLRKVVAPEGSVFPVNAVIALVGEPDDPLPDNLDELLAAGGTEAKPQPEEAAQSSEAPASVAQTAPAPIAIPQDGRIRISPRARKTANAGKVPAQVLRGTGPGGRIVEEDVLAHIEKRDRIKATPTAIALAFEHGVDITLVSGTGPGGKVTKEDVLGAQPTVAAAAPAGRRIELTAMRRVVADRMTQSKREAPHFYLMMEMDMTATVKLRAELNASGPARIGFHDFIICACAKALAENPAMNVVWAGDAIQQRGEVNIGLAVGLDEGLIVPVVRNADRLSLSGIAKASAALIEKARSKKLTPDEYEGGCLTLSNLGMYDVDNFIPVINPGESAILGVGRIAQKPVVIDGGLHIRSMMGCTLSADHRAVDGAIASAFLKRVKDLLEEPQQLA